MCHLKVRAFPAEGLGGEDKDKFVVPAVTFEGGEAPTGT